MNLGTTRLRLPFGNQDAVIDDSLNRFCERLEKAIPGEFDADITTSGQSFHHASSTISFGNLRLTSLAVSSLHLNRKTETAPTLVIPFAGNLHANVGGKKYAAQAGSSALLFSGKPRVGLLDNQLSEILITLNHDILLQVAQTMLGPERTCPVDAIDLEEDRELSLKVGYVSFDTLFRNHCRTVDGLFHNPKALAMLGMGDAFYRAIVCLLAPALFLSDEPRETDTKSRDARALDFVCDYIESHIDRVITVTDLEQISGLSARGLQYAFLRRFDCSPMEWVRQHRLTLARSTLRAGVKGTTVTKVAFELGFNNLSLFARYYRERFGEQPSVTLQRALRQD